MSETQNSDAVEVTQADREIAWPFVSANSIAGQDFEGFFAGLYDDCDSVQVFARHRLAAPSHNDEVVKLREALETAARRLEYHGFVSHALDARAAIRAQEIRP